MTVAEADKYKQLLHAKKHGYKLHLTTFGNAHFVHVEKVTLERVHFKEEDEGSIAIDKIEKIMIFYGDVLLDELDKEE